MSFVDIQMALDVRLSTLIGSTPIAWENVEYQPALDAPYLRPTTLNGSSNLICLADGSQSHEGIYRVDAVYPMNKGPSPLLAKLDAIYAHFKANMVLVVNATSVWIRAINILPRNIAEGSWFMGSIDINFITYEGGIGGITPTPPEAEQWITTAVSLTPASGKRYITANDVSRVVFTLPTVCQPGYYFRIAGYGLAGWRINCPAGMSIVYGDQETSIAGALESVNPHDCIELVCVVANTKFEELSSQGNITVI